MKFVCLGCLDKQTWGKLSPAEQQKMVEACTDFDRELYAKGQFANGFALQDSAEATTIRWLGGIRPWTGHSGQKWAELDPRGQDKARRSRS